MSIDDKAKALGIDLSDFTPSGTLAPATRIGNTIYVSGHVSTGYIGKLGRDLDVETGKQAARVCAIDLLKAAYTITGTLNTLRPRKLLGAVNSLPEFTDQHLVINGASELLWELYDGELHARSALGFASLPNGFAVEIEAVFEALD
ncbi:MAG: RidA family protein [Chloroflexi bacterium]|nr:RidA family protein [Chloroflexota bacterium]MCY4248232.1 RidA family protein [Chloroflexota bacterium]